MKKYLFRIGGILLVIGAIMPLFLPTWAPWVYAVGALLFASIQISDRYEGRNIVIRRLRRQQIIGALLLVVTAFMMFKQLYEIRPFRGGEWKIVLTMAMVIEMYTAFRIDAEEKKENRR